MKKSHINPSPFPKISVINIRSAIPSINTSTHRTQAYRSLKSANYNNRNTKTNICIQEIQLNNSKWFVFN